MYSWYRCHEGSQIIGYMAIYECCHSENINTLWCKKLRDILMQFIFISLLKITKQLQNSVKFWFFCFVVLFTGYWYIHAFCGALSIEGLCAFIKFKSILGLRHCLFWSNEALKMIFAQKIIWPRRKIYLAIFIYLSNVPKPFQFSLS
jgi:hypothetical protein